ncbi:MAG: histidine triad nucleotide-binding protein [Gemmatimonadales bacterium]|nr:MAG: histidine triad nucleotide-binding protein [Gemmatimonadales bacterium]
MDGWVRLSEFRVVGSGGGSHHFSGHPLAQEVFLVAHDCIFCRIVAGEIPAQVVHDDDRALVFRDVNPQAPTHLLVIPKRHVASADHLTREDEGLAGHLLLAAGEAARSLGLAGDGYRIVTNIGRNGGQTVSHLHLHVLGGRSLGWPPG